MAIPLKIKVSDHMGRLKLNKKQLSELTGIRPNTIKNYYDETIQRFDRDHLEKLCEVFDCQPGDILEYVKDEKSS